MLRAVDWRFLLRQAKRPRALLLNSRRDVAEALPLIADPAPAAPGEADLVVMGFPRRRKLRRARQALRAGGEVVCLWRRPRVAGVQRARARLRRAGFESASFHWPGPLPNQMPEFWLPLGAPDTASHLFANRPPRSRAEALLRRLLRPAELTGVLAPICATARLPGQVPAQPLDELLTAGPVLLLAEGSRARQKVVCLTFSGATPSLAVKCARIPSTDRSLEREASALNDLARLRPELGLAPRVRAIGTRVGRSAIAESIVPGQLPPPEPLTEELLERLAPKLTDRLIDLVDRSRQRPDADWRRRLVEDPLERFEKQFGDQLEAGVVEFAGEALAALPDLPVAWEHRDCAVWNIHITGSEVVGIFDWAGSEPRGLPGLDLTYFLATSAFMLDRVEMSDPVTTLASYSKLLDPGTPRGEVASACVQRYCEGLKLDPALFPLLRLRSWIAKVDGKDPAAPSYAALAANEVARLRAPR